MADRFAEMEVFLKTAEAGSFAAAARWLGLSAQMVGKQVATIEERLGTRLINRSTRRQSLTEAGQIYLEGCRRTLAELASTEDDVAAHAAEPQGLLRVTAPVAFGTLRLVPEAAHFLAQHRHIRLQMELTDRRLNLIEEGFDVAIRIGSEPSSTLVTRGLAPYRLILCASPDYISRCGVPTNLNALERHECLDYSFATHPAPVVWTFRSGEAEITAEPASRLTVNDSRALVEAALAGFGIALVAEMLVGHHLAAGRLVQVLGEYGGPSRPMRLLFAARKAQPPKLRAFIDWAYDTFGRLE
jgi:DNA-binding transcriptional LysR family regulator